MKCPMHSIKLSLFTHPDSFADPALSSDPLAISNSCSSLVRIDEWREEFPLELTATAMVTREPLAAEFTVPTNFILSLL
jgi:hypothetical protein